MCAVTYVQSVPISPLGVLEWLRSQTQTVAGHRVGQADVIDSSERRSLEPRSGSMIAVACKEEICVGQEITTD